MAVAAVKRLRLDLKQITKNPPVGVSADLCNDDLFEWDALICGPGDTPFEGATFRMKLNFPPTYPNKPPTVWFYSRMFHPNVYPNGRICLDILEKPEMWDPTYDSRGILSAIQAMLGDPNPDSPANGEANELFLRKPKKYEKRVLQIVQMSNGEAGEEGRNLNKEDLDDEIEARLENLDLSGYAEDQEVLKNFLRK